MNNRQILFVAFLFFFSGLAAHSQDSPIAVEVKPAQATVKEGEDFSVSTVLRNTGTETQIMWHEACGYGDLWISDNGLIRIAPSSCSKPGFSRVTLKAGEDFRADIQIFARLPESSGEGEWVTFRLGFKSEFGSEDDPTHPRPPTRTLWSNAVTVKVTRDPNPPRNAGVSKTDLPADGNGAGGVTITHVCGTTHYDPSRKHAPAVMLTGVQVSVAKSEFVFSNKTKTFNGAVTVTNKSPNAIPGPFQILFESLTDGVTMAIANGDFGCSPYVTIPNITALGPGESASVDVRFSNPEKKPIKFIPLIYSGILD